MRMKHKMEETRKKEVDLAPSVRAVDPKDLALLKLQKPHFSPNESYLALASNLVASCY